MGIGGRNGSTDKFALIANVGMFNGQLIHPKLTSALPGGIDSDCAAGSASDHKACSIATNPTYGTVDFFIKKNTLHPIVFQFMNVNGDPVTLRRWQHGVFLGTGYLQCVQLWRM